jgi:WD40 repeat protein
MYHCSQKYQLSSEYITTLDVTPDRLVVGTASGEIILVPGGKLLEEQDYSIDVVGFSRDGEWLSGAGQGGRVWVWHRSELVTTLEQGDAWIDRLAWHPQAGEFVFSLGRYLQIWSKEIRDIVHTIDFTNSAVRTLDWHPQGEWLTTGGYQGIKSWFRPDWDRDPVCFDLPTSAEVVKWNPDGHYLAAITIDGLVMIFDWLDDQFANFPWRLQGFPGKIRGLEWSGRHKLVTWSGTEIVVWKLHPDPLIGWEPTVLEGHTDLINVVSACTTNNLLASGGKDGLVIIWQGNKLHQTLLIEQEITGIKWRNSNLIVATIDGEVCEWQNTRAKGFGK